MSNFLEERDVTFDPTDDSTIWDGASRNKDRQVPYSKNQNLPPNNDDWRRLVAEVREMQRVLVDHESRLED